MGYIDIDIPCGSTNEEVWKITWQPLKASQRVSVSPISAITTPCSWFISSSLINSFMSSKSTARWKIEPIENENTKQEWKLILKEEEICMSNN